MARRRRSRRSRFHAKGNMMGKAWHWITMAVEPTAAAVSFVNQISAKDIATYGQTNYNALPNMEKLKFLGNVIVGRTTGFNPYNKYGTYPQTINPSGMINKYVGVGALSLLLGHALPSQLVGGGVKTVLKKGGRGALIGGLLGGLFDANTGGRAGAQAGAPAVRALGGYQAIGASTVQGHFGSLGMATGAYMGANSGY